MCPPSTITWICPAELLELAQKYADQEGTCLIANETGVYLGILPKRTLKLYPTPQAWEQLSFFVQEALLPVMGFIGYEMGAFADPAYPLPWYPSSYASTVFFEPSKIYASTHLPPLKQTLPQNLNCNAREEKSSYLSKIEHIRNLIAEGKVYQVNLSQSFRFQHEGVDAFQLFQSLYARNPAKYAAYLNVGEQKILSLSPELWITSSHNILTTRPIKGTAARGKTIAEDEQFKQQLQNSEKNRSELLMITDLMRHDLYSVCQPGSIKLIELCKLEAHPDVFHLVSTLQGVPNTLPAVEKLRRLFPAGSITGCPKKASMEVIAKLEQRHRGVYTGSIGMFFPQGDFCFNVAIRTAIWTEHDIEIQLGGAIVYDSDPEEEYLETLHKGRTFFHTLSTDGYQRVF